MNFRLSDKVNIWPLNATLTPNQCYPSVECLYFVACLLKHTSLWITGSKCRAIGWEVESLQAYEILTSRRLQLKINLPMANLNQKQTYR